MHPINFVVGSLLKSGMAITWRKPLSLPNVTHTIRGAILKADGYNICDEDLIKMEEPNTVFFKLPYFHNFFFLNSMRFQLGQPQSSKACEKNFCQPRTQNMVKILGL